MRFIYQRTGQESRILYSALQLSCNMICVQLVFSKKCLDWSKKYHRSFPNENSMVENKLYSFSLHHSLKPAVKICFAGKNVAFIKEQTEMAIKFSLKSNLELLENPGYLAPLAPHLEDISRPV